MLISKGVLYCAFQPVIFNLGENPRKMLKKSYGPSYDFFHFYIFFEQKSHRIPSLISLIFTYYFEQMVIWSPLKFFSFFLPQNYMVGLWCLQGGTTWFLDHKRSLVWKILCYILWHIADYEEFLHIFQNFFSPGFNPPPEKLEKWDSGGIPGDKGTDDS